MKKIIAPILLIIFIIFVFSTLLSGQTEIRKDRNPIIIIPGIMGSKLVNKKTNEVVWVKFAEAKSDDLRLPVSPDLESNRDDLEATDIIDKIRIIKYLPGVSVYQDMIDFIEKKAGYRRADWNISLSDDDRDTYYVFPYDWRRDNVESAHLLIQKIEKLKARLKKPNLKFDVIAHSMGGLITRYAAMYGTGDLTDKPRPNWSGSKYFERVFMFGTPNEGSMGALDTLYNGYWIDTFGNRFYPDFLKREVAFTIPSLYQLLPHGRLAKFYGDDLRPLDVDIYDVKTWKKYGWTVLADQLYMSRLSKARRVKSERYFEAVLLRARLFHEALDIKTPIPDSLKFFAFGSDCKNTTNGAIVYFDIDQGKWETLTTSDSFKNIRGQKVPEKLVKQTIFSVGDGTVTKSSLLAERISELNGQSLFLNDSKVNGQKIVCDDHTTLTGNKKLQESMFAILSGNPNQNDATATPK